MLFLLNNYLLYSKQKYKIIIYLNNNFTNKTFGIFYTPKKLDRQERE